MEKKNIMKAFYQGMEQNRIRAYFQPIYTANGSHIASAEALCRIIQPNGEVIMPKEFIPRLEYTTEVCCVDWYMVKKVCDMLTELQLAGISSIPISVNLSRRHVEEWDAVAHLCSIVDSYDLDHTLVVIEITESGAVDDILLQAMIERISKKGFPVAVDDFGSGNSSLRFIRDVPFDILKLDRSLLSQDCSEKQVRIVLESLLEMAHSMDVESIVEGVENESQRAFLDSCGCILLQGNYLCHPLPEDEFLHLLKSRRHQESFRMA